VAVLYETASRAIEVLSIHVEDLDVDNKRARVRSKGGDLDWLHFQTGVARLLPRLIAGRTYGRCSWPTGPQHLAVRPPPSTAVLRPAAPD
jgi:hypothetical protein